MNLGQLRTVLGRQVQDVDGVQWSTAEKNQAINETYYHIQGRVQAVDPEAVIFWDTMNLVAGQNWYPMPPTFGLISVGIKTSTSITEFVKLDRKRFEAIKSISGTTQYYTQRGEWVGIFPAPSTSVTDGLEVMHRPIHTLTADSDEPKLKLPLHYGLVLGAKIFLLGDTNESSEGDKTKLNDILENIGRWYGQNYDDAESFTLEGL